MAHDSPIVRAKENLKLSHGGSSWVGLCCYKFIVCYYMCNWGLCLFFSCCPFLGVFFCKFIVGITSFCVSRDNVCSSCYDKAAVRSGEVVLLSLFVHCLLLPPLSDLVYDCSSYRDKALSVLGRRFCCRCLFIVCYCLH